MIEYGWPQPAPRTLTEPAPSPDATHSAPRPIAPDDLRPGDVFEARHQRRVDAEGNWAYTGTTTYHLLERPDAALHAAVEAAWDADEFFNPSAFVAALAAAGYVIEPRPTTGDLHA